MTVIGLPTGQEASGEVSGGGDVGGAALVRRRHSYQRLEGYMRVAFVLGSRVHCPPPSS
jgi:hypothetical protein